MRSRSSWAFLLASFLVVGANFLIRVASPDRQTSSGLVTEFLRVHGTAHALGMFAALVLVVWIGLWVYGFLRGLSTPGVTNFWRGVADNPDEAYVFFQASSAWKILPHPLPSDYQKTVPEREWAGPFDLYVPQVGARVKIFGRVGDYEESRDEFVRIVAERENDGD